MTQQLEAAVDVVLKGGPQGISSAGVLGGASICDQDRLKIPYRGGYEHFERLESAAHGPAVYQWVARTMLAE
jgi:hypothetical protein